MAADNPAASAKQVLGPDDVRRAVTRMAHEIIERNRGVDGVVLTFADVTERVNALAVRKARDLAEAIVDTVQMPLLVLDGAGTVISANKAFGAELGADVSTIVGQPFNAIADGQWNTPELQQFLLDATPDNGKPARLPIQHSAPGRVARQLMLHARRITSPPGDGDGDFIVLAVEPH